MDVATTLAGTEQRWAARTTHSAAAANLPTGQEIARPVGDGQPLGFQFQGKSSPMRLIG